MFPRCSNNTLALEPLNERSQSKVVGGSGLGTLAALVEQAILLEDIDFVLAAYLFW